MDYGDKTKQPQQPQQQQQQLQQPQQQQQQLQQPQQQQENSGKRQSSINIVGHEKGREEHYIVLSCWTKKKWMVVIINHAFLSDVIKKNKDKK